jgi:chromosome segregation ATPase
MDQVIAGLGHKIKMKTVMADILALKDSITSFSDEHDKNNQEMQQVKFQVAQYEGILPVYQSRLKDTEELNKRLGNEKTELTKNIDHLKEKLDRTESLDFSMGTPEAIRQRRPTRHLSAGEANMEQASSSSEAVQNKSWAIEGH